MKLIIDIPEEVRNDVLTDGVLYCDYDPILRDAIKNSIVLSECKPEDCISREFQEIVVDYPPEDLCTYPEYKWKPYFSIKYKEGNDYIIGYGTYNPEVFSRYLRDYFMPSVTPQEPKTGHWILRNSFLVPYKCSECDYKSERYDNYCPNCGCRMEGEIE